MLSNSFKIEELRTVIKDLVLLRHENVVVTPHVAFNSAEALERIGKAHGKTAAQVCLRYLVQHDVIVIPRTSRSERLKENFEIFDFKLSSAEMTEIAGLANPRGRIVEWSGGPEWD